MAGAVGDQAADQHRDVGQRERAREPPAPTRLVLMRPVGVDLGGGDELQRDAPALDRVEDLGLASTSRARAGRPPRGRSGDSATSWVFGFTDAAMMIVRSGTSSSRASMPAATASGVPTPTTSTSPGRHWRARLQVSASATSRGGHASAPRRGR